MRFPFVWRKSAEAETAAWKERAARQEVRALRAERTAKSEAAARREIAALYADLCDTHGLPVAEEQQQIVGTVREFDAAEARRAAGRIAGLTAEVARARAEAQAEKKRADALQGRLDDALGLNTGPVDLGASWQDRRETHMRYDKTAEETTS